MTDINWEKHFRDYENSGLTIKKYCAREGLEYSAFRNQRYHHSLIKRKRSTPTVLKSASFKEYSIGVKLQLSVESEDSVAIHGISIDQLPIILRALDAIS